MKPRKRNHRSIRFDETVKADAAEVRLLAPQDQARREREAEEIIFRGPHPLPSQPARPESPPSPAPAHSLPQRASRMPKSKASLRDVAVRSIGRLKKTEEFIGEKGQDAQALTVGAHTENVGAQAPTPQKVGAHTGGLVGAHKKDRHKPGRARRHVRLSSEIDAKIQHFLIDSGLNLQDFMEIVAAHFFECVGAHKATNVGAQAPIDDLMIYKTRDDIIMCYNQYTGNKWKPRDDAVGREFNNVDPRIIEIGIIHTLVNYSQSRTKGQRIYSFNYFVNEIRKVAEAPFDKKYLDAYLRSRREMWAKLSAEKGKNLKVRG